MPNWITLSADRFPVTPLSVAAYKEKVSQSWAANARLWTTHTSSDQFHDVAFAAILKALAREAKQSEGVLASVVDFGCGSGALLRQVGRSLQIQVAAGVDSCSAFASYFDNSDIAFFEADLEGTKDVLPFHTQVGICAFSLVEIFEVAAAMRNMSEVLTQGGLLLVIVLDPLVEFLRFLKWKLAMPNASAFAVGDQLAIASHFVAGAALSPQPYYRLIRPIDAYIQSAFAASLGLERVSSIEISSENSPRGVLLEFRRL